MKVLGVQWCRDQDTLSFSGQRFPADSVVATKRVVLSVIARLFDRLGLLTPFTIVAKCLFQQMWEMQVGWDDPLPESCADVFSRWLDRHVHHLSVYCLTDMFIICRLYVQHSVNTTKCASCLSMLDITTTD